MTVQAMLDNQRAARARLWAPQVVTKTLPAPQAALTVAPVHTQLADDELPAWPWPTNKSGLKFRARRALIPAAILSAKRRTDAALQARAEQICRIVAQDEGVSVDDIKSSLRLPEYVRARALAIHLVAKANHDWSTPRLAKFFRKRDHTTIVYSLRKFRTELDGLKYVKAWIKSKAPTNADGDATP